jgi:glycosyltransferase involved in cell wall biosynthesis
MGPLVSVVVTSCTLGRLKDIQELLDSLQAQTYPRLETIFVGEGDPELSDTVAAYTKEKGLTNLRVLVNDGRPGLSSARNLGAQNARGEIVAFIDDDATAFPDWVEKIVQTFSHHPKAIGVTGPAFPRWDDDSMRWFPEEFYWILSCPTPGWTGYTKPAPVRNAWGMNMAFRREAFEVARFSEVFAGGEKTGADDVDFSMQVRRATGREILFAPSVCVGHKVYRHRLSAAFIRKKAFRDGYAKAVLKVLYPEGHGKSFEIDLETALLARIFLRFFPAMLRRLVRDPFGARRQLRLASLALFYSGAGYFVGTLSLLLMRFKKRVNPNERRIWDGRSPKS